MSERIESKIFRQIIKALGFYHHQLNHSPTLDEIKHFIEMINETLRPIANVEEKIERAMEEMQEMNICNLMPGECYVLFTENPLLKQHEPSHESHEEQEDGEAIPANQHSSLTMVHTQTFGFVSQMVHIEAGQADSEENVTLIQENVENQDETEEIQVEQATTSQNIDEAEANSSKETTNEEILEENPEILTENEPKSIQTDEILTSEQEDELLNEFMETNFEPLLENDDL